MVSQTAAAGTGRERTAWYTASPDRVLRTDSAVSSKLDLERRRMDSSVLRLLAAAPGVVRVYVRDDRDCREYFIVADLSDREMEDEFYRREAEVIRSAPPSSVDIHLINLAWFEPSPGFSPPEGAKPLELQTRGL